MNGHIIVCGMGHIGSRVVELLGRLEVPVTVVTLPTRADWIRSAEARGATTETEGDAAQAWLS